MSVEVLKGAAHLALPIDAIGGGLSAATDWVGRESMDTVQTVASQPHQGWQRRRRSDQRHEPGRHRC
jgi:hypothetical protein